MKKQSFRFTTQLIDVVIAHSYSIAYSTEFSWRAKIKKTCRFKNLSAISINMRTFINISWGFLFWISFITSTYHIYIVHNGVLLFFRKHCAAKPLFGSCATARRLYFVSLLFLLFLFCCLLFLLHSLFLITIYNFYFIIVECNRNAIWVSFEGIQCSGGGCRWCYWHKKCNIFNIKTKVFFIRCHWNSWIFNLKVSEMKRSRNERKWREKRLHSITRRCCCFFLLPCVARKRNQRISVRLPGLCPKKKYDAEK